MAGMVYLLWQDSF